jgi:hypothetical protein
LRPNFISISLNIREFKNKLNDKHTINGWGMVGILCLEGLDILVAIGNDEKTSKISIHTE